MDWIQNALGFGVSPAEIKRCSDLLDEYYDVNSDSTTKNEGGFVIRMIEWLAKALQWRWYFDAYSQLTRSNTPLEPLYKRVTSEQATKYRRPQIPATMSVQSAVSILPFHTVCSPFGPLCFAFVYEIYGAVYIPLRCQINQINRT